MLQARYPELAPRRRGQLLSIVYGPSYARSARGGLVFLHLRLPTYCGPCLLFWTAWPSPCNLARCWGQLLYRDVL